MIQIYTIAAIASFSPFKHFFADARCSAGFVRCPYFSIGISDILLLASLLILRFLEVMYKMHTFDIVGLFL